MSGPEHLPPDDHELEDFLAGRGPHRARYRAASPEQTPAALDAVVLAQARAAMAAAPPGARVVRGPARWRLPLSLAATLVLGLGLVSRVQREAELPPAAKAPLAVADTMAAADAPAPVAEAEEQDVAAASATVAEVAAGASAPKEALAKAAVVENRALATAAQERMDSALGQAERQARQAKAEAAVPVVAAAESLPAPPPSPPAPAASAPSVAGMAMADTVTPAAPPAAAMAAAPQMELQAKRRAPVAAFSAAPLRPPGRYRAESGAGLELLADGRFVLSMPAGEEPATTLSGRRVQESRGERLLPDTEGALPCALWLQPEPESPEVLRLHADCENGHAGRYLPELVRP